MRIPTTAQIRSLESDWIANCGEHWGQVLMEIAGRGAAIRTLRLWQESPGQVVVVCGKGNNGGDGLVVARYLALWGHPGFGAGDSHNQTDGGNCRPSKRESRRRHEFECKSEFEWKFEFECKFEFERKVECRFEFE
ncbi:MAG: NAD(P)H-hydrate epimerase [Candidatus Melainabacteria bacterium]|nr:NAD(P)H-hydrate epimerase [Candidatus Melainabacteria bacterium]